ncbi:GDSL esterase/lipase At1g29670 [Euphorbia peplus]|nr:GDSL esterase/lipase At1g29670 [Euphorbia peplus]
MKMIKLQCLLLAFNLFIIVSKSSLFNKDKKKEVPCYFIFGDSLVDNGNNNNLNTKTKVNYPPYGIDFPNGPTGRFTNGRTSADEIGERLGFKKLIPSFLEANGSEILEGVNYASGASGILPETGKQAGDNVEMDRQLRNHQVTVSRIVDIFNKNETAAQEHLNKCFYLVATGNNDFINNYFMPGYNTSTIYSPLQYAGVLTKKILLQLKELHRLGARKIGVNSVSSIGCTPAATILYRASRQGSICVDRLNFAANLYNQKLVLLLFRLNLELPGARFIQIGSLGYEPATYIPGVNNVTLSSCCKTNELGLCIPNGEVCNTRKISAFWDGFHPTEAVNKFIGNTAYILIKSTILRF